MSKRELIDAIIQHNRTAAPEFLARFQEQDLKAYLQRVCEVRTHEVRVATTVDAKEQLVLV